MFAREYEVQSNSKASSTVPPWNSSRKAWKRAILHIRFLVAIDIDVEVVFISIRHRSSNTRRLHAIIPLCILS